MDNNTSGEQRKILSIHWGFSLGGVAKYAELLEQVGNYQDLMIKSVCIHGNDWPLDTATMSKLNIESITIKSKLDFSCIKKLQEFIEQEKPDAIITHGFNAHIIYWMTERLYTSDVQWLASYHGEYHGNSALRRLAGVLFNRISIILFRKHIDRIISVAEYSKRHLVDNGVNPDKITVIHNGIPCLDIAQGGSSHLRDEWGIKDDEIAFGVISRLDPVKGIGYLIDAFAQIRPQIAHAKLIIIGSGSITDSLKAQVDRNGLSDVTVFAGYRSDVNNCYAALDVFVLPSLAEYHSIALLEAMRAGKAIISTDVGGNLESVRDGKEALVVGPADADALSQSLMQLLTNEELRHNLAMNARQRFVSEFTSDTMIERTADWLHDSLTNYKACVQ